MSVDLLGSPENRRVLRAAAIADGIVDEADVTAGWTVKVGGPIYRQILPLSGFATGSPAWMAEMRALAILHPIGGTPPAPLAISITAPADAASIPDTSDIIVTADVTGGTGPYSTQFNYAGVDIDTPKIGVSPTTTIPEATTVVGAGVAIMATVTDAGGTASGTVTVEILLIVAGGPRQVSGPFDTAGLEYWVRDCLIGFETNDGDDTPDVWVTEEQMLAMDITGEQKALIQATLDEFGC